MRAIAATIAMLSISLFEAAQRTDEELRLETIRRQLTEQCMRTETAHL